MRPSVRVLADDLTGALDTAVCFAACGVDLPVSVTWNAPDRGTSALCTNVRDADQAVAARSAASTAGWLMEVEQPFKKVDSRLRGHVAVELAAVLSVSGPARIIVAPALPAQGRVVRGGRVHSSGQATAAWQLEPIDLASELRARGVVVTPAVAGDAAPPGVSLYDAATDEDLDRIVAAGLASGGRVLWCGSYGLAGALARALGCGPVPRFHARRPTLILVGTRHPRTMDQLARVAAAAPDALACIAPDGSGTGAVAAALAIGRPRIVRVTLPGDADADRAAALIQNGFAALLAEAPAPGTLAATGGATLLGALRSLEASGVTVAGAFAPGIPGGRIVGGRWHGRPMIAKSGGFGEPDALLRILGED